MDPNPSHPSKRPSFSINNLLGLNESSSINDVPSKIPRFFIENLLNLDEYGNQTGSGEKNELEKYVKKLDSNVHPNKKFQLLNLKTRFIIQNIPADPEGLLLGIFQHCIDLAIEECHQHGFGAEHLGVTISSELLDLGDIWTPVRPINENISEALLNQFMKVSQSKKQNGITLWGEPFTITITTVNVSGLPDKKQLKGGSNKPRIPPFPHRINEKSLMRIRNTDGNNYCLFMSLQASMIQHTDGKSKRQFYDYLNNRPGQRGAFHRDTLELMKTVGAPFNKKKYDATLYVPRIVKFWNEKMKPNRFRVYIFSASGFYEPDYKYGPEEYNVALTLYYSNEHFDAVRREGSLFGKPYCVECKTTYDRGSTHSKNCRQRCINCGGVGIGYPCKNNRDFTKECKVCFKTFTNEECYKRHIKTKLCLREKHCKECGVTYAIKLNTRKGRKGHQCGERWCCRCNEFKIIGHNCYIQPLEPEAEKEVRIIAFDLETMQHQYLENSNNKRWHEPNFVSAKVACANCISSGDWKLSLKNKTPCKICGQNRTVAFSHKPFKNTQVDYQNNSTEPLKEFVNWLLNVLSDKYKTYVFSHFGGRFDMVLVFRELFTVGIKPTMIRKGNRMYEMVAKRRIGQNRGVGKADIIFRDFFNLVPTSLAALVPTFGLDVEEKPYFPHFANKPQNYGKLILPTKDDYLADGMMPEKRKIFDKWYEKHGSEPFLLDEAWLPME